MNINDINSIIVAAAPAVTSIIGIVAAFHKIKKNNKATTEQITNDINIVKEEISKTQEFETLKKELLIAHQENKELRKLTKELLTKIDRIKREEV